MTNAGPQRVITTTTGPCSTGVMTRVTRKSYHAPHPPPKKPTTSNPIVLYHTITSIIIIYYYTIHHLSLYNYYN